MAILKTIQITEGFLNFKSIGTRKNMPSLSMSPETDFTNVHDISPSVDEELQCMME